MYESKFIFALVLTVGIEILVIAAAAKLLAEKAPRLRLIGITAMASVLTLPYVWFVIPPFVPGQSVIEIVEIFAFVIEAIIYRGLLPASWGRSAVYSGSANLASYFFGLYWYG